MYASCSKGWECRELWGGHTVLHERRGRALGAAALYIIIIQPRSTSIMHHTPHLIDILSPSALIDCDDDGMCVNVYTSTKAWSSSSWYHGPRKEATEGRGSTGARCSRRHLGADHDLELDLVRIDLCHSILLGIELAFTDSQLSIEL